MDKTCTKCRETKPISDFYRDRNRKDGRQPWCKPCANAGVRRSTPHRVRISPKLTPENYREHIQVTEDEHWRWKVGRNIGGGKTALTTDDRIYRTVPASWCDDEELSFKCLNPDHFTSNGELPTMSKSELWDGIEEAGNASGLGFNVTRPINEFDGEARRLIYQPDDDYHYRRESLNVDMPATKFLKEHGYNWNAEPLKRNRNRNR